MWYKHPFIKTFIYVVQVFSVIYIKDMKSNKIELKFFGKTAIFDKMTTYCMFLVVLSKILNVFWSLDMIFS